MIDFSGEEWRVFDRWLCKHHPDGQDDDEFFGIFEAVEAFNKWARTNSIEKYRDAAQPTPAFAPALRSTPPADGNRT